MKTYKKFQIKDKYRHHHAFFLSKNMQKHTWQAGRQANKRAKVNDKSDLLLTQQTSARDMHEIFVLQTSLSHSTYHFSLRILLLMFHYINYIRLV